MSGKLISNPSDFKCPNCNVEFPKRMSMTGRGDGKLHKGLIMVCSECAGIAVLGDTTLHPMTKEEFTALDQTTKRALFITRSEIEKTIKAGGKWSPHEKN